MKRRHLSRFAPRPTRVEHGRAARAALCLAVMLSAGLRLTPSARAATPPLPPSVYPPHTKLTYFPTWTNRQFDCEFGWFCDGTADRPFLHASTEDELGRTGGWAMWGEWGDYRMAFELYSSVYRDRPASDGVGWNQLAMIDEQAALVNVQSATPARTAPSVLPSGVHGSVLAAYVNRGWWHVFFLTAAWGTNREVEAVVAYPLRKKWEARRYLIAQVRAAVRIADRADS